MCLLSKPHKVTGLGRLPFGSALGTALDGRSLFSLAKDVVVFLILGRDEDEDDKGREEEDYEEDEEPGPKAMLAFARSYAAWGSACRSCCHHVARDFTSCSGSSIEAQIYPPAQSGFGKSGRPHGLGVVFGLDLRSWDVALTRLPLCSLMNRNHQPTRPGLLPCDAQSYTAVNPT